MNLKFSVSVENGCNKITSSSEDRFLGIGKGSLIKVGEEPILYTVIGRDSFFFIKEFYSENSKILSFADDIGSNIQKGDILKITYKEYEAKFISSIVSEGSGYIPESDLNIIGGVLSVDVSVGFGQPTSIYPSSVNSDGAILQAGIKYSGKYLSPPQNPVKSRSNRGSNAEFDIKYIEIPNRSFVDRTVADIYISEGKTFIVLDYSLPPNLSSGKISVEKSVLTLSENYSGKTQKNLSYQIYKDFTPLMKLPLQLKNSLSPEITYNKSCMIIDSEICNLRNEILDLKDRLVKLESVIHINNRT